MSLESAQAHLRKWNRDKDIKLFDVSSATVQLAALALGVEEARIAKTISLRVPPRNPETPGASADPVNAAGAGAAGMGAVGAWATGGDAAQAMLIVAAGDVKIDNQKFKQFYGFKARMLSPDEVRELIGHEIGGVCPFGIKPGVHVYLDESLRRFTTFYPACGSGNSAIELSCEELETLAESKQWVDVCRVKEPQ
jgi:prolyl-tRNA editing enzyme YbaK/EbsC (Cys-tRNA(Pro) deacylase)